MRTLITNRFESKGSKQKVFLPGKLLVHKLNLSDFSLKYHASNEVTPHKRCVICTWWWNLFLLIKIGFVLGTLQSYIFSCLLDKADKVYVFTFLRLKSNISTYLRPLQKSATFFVSVSVFSSAQNIHIPPSLSSFQTWASLNWLKTEIS